MNGLKVFLSPDLHSAEQLCVESCLQQMESSIPIQRIHIDSQHKDYFKRDHSQEPAWIVSQDWRGTLEFLSAVDAKDKLMVSVFSVVRPKASLWETWFQSIQGPLPPHIKLLTHSALSHKFLKELEGVPEIQLEQIPLPLPQVVTQGKTSPFVVGSFSPFVPESNLHFILTLAHYFKKEEQPIQMKLIGQGPLKKHLERLVGALDLEGYVSLEAPNIEKWEKLDAVLFFPTRADHFSPLLIAGALGSVPICGVQTLGEFSFVDNHNSFLFEQEETKAIAELIIRLQQNPLLLSEVEKRFKNKMQKQFSPSVLGAQYLKLFSAQPYQTQNFVRCAP